MKNNNRNIRLFAENNGKADGFSIFIEFSGQREYLMSHRHNAPVYELLKDGLRLDELMRRRPCRNYKASGYSFSVPRGKSKTLEQSIRHITAVAAEYVSERESYRLEAGGWVSDAAAA